MVDYRLNVWVIALVVCLLMGLSMPGEASKGDDVKKLLSKPLNEREAIIWYLDHSGWAIKTRSHLVIFDYCEREKCSKCSLQYGYVNPTEIQDLDVLVFVSHKHGDHYDPVILQWEKKIKHITYVFGWQAHREVKPRCIYMVEPREKKTIGAAEVLTISHQFDGIPEKAFLIRLDGITIFHAGDHGSIGKEPHPVFKDNIDYMSANTKDVDIAFIPVFGMRGRGRSGMNPGDWYVIEKLHPKFIFPMHCGGCEDIYLTFACDAKAGKAKTKVYAAQFRGQRFVFKKNKIKN